MKYYILIIGQHQWRVKRLIDCVAIIRILSLPVPPDMKIYDCGIGLSDIQFLTKGNQYEKAPSHNEIGLFFV